MSSARKIESAVLHVLPTYGPPAGGVGTVVNNIVKNWPFESWLETQVFDLGGGEKFTLGRETLMTNYGILPIKLFKLFCDLRISPSITHLHGVWHPISASCAWARRTSGGRLLCTPHGMLTEWILSQKPLRKKVARLGWENLNWNSADCFHALTENEAKEIAALVPKEKPIAVIGNGVALPDSTIVSSSENKAPYILYLGRFHEKKGISILIEAWKQLGDSTRGVTLKLVGWGDMEDLRREMPPRIEVLPPVFSEDEKGALLSNADFVVLPSFSEGLPMVILESWSYSVPVIMTPGCNLQDGFEWGAAVRVEADVDSLKVGLRAALGMSRREREQMGRRGRTLCEEHYSISRMCEKLADLYSWLLSPSLVERPSSINFYQ